MGNWEETFEACIWSQGLLSLLPGFGEVRYGGEIPRCAASEREHHGLWTKSSEATIQLNPSFLLNLFFQVLLPLWLGTDSHKHYLWNACVSRQCSHGGKPFSYTRAIISVHSTELATLTFKAFLNICSQWITEEYSREPKLEGELHRPVWEGQKGALKIKKSRDWLWASDLQSILLMDTCESLSLRWWALSRVWRCIAFCLAFAMNSFF